MYKTFHNNEDARGIGLLLPKIVEAIGGKIEVNSELNKGTTFKIYFKYE
jgi:sensor histidine kinase regulating citrate/malate metabolism